MQIYEFINNLNSLYKPALLDKQMPFYNEFLEFQSEAFLENLWRVVVREHLRTSPPTIGELNKYASSITQEYSTALDYSKGKVVLSDRDILDSYLGKWALKQGWADSYLVHCREKGVPEQTDDMIAFFQLGQHKAKMAYDSLKEGDIFSETLKRFYYSMREKNAVLSEKFAYLIKSNSIAIS